MIIDGHDLPFKGALVQIRNSTDSAVGVYTDNAKGMKQSCGVTSATHESTTPKTMSILTFQVGAAVPGQILNCRLVDFLLSWCNKNYVCDLLLLLDGSLSIVCDRS